jgi:hypothetical protein
MPEPFLRIAGHIPYSEAIAIVSFVLATLVFALQFRARRIVLGSIFAFLILAVGSIPFLVSHALESRGVYHIQVYLVRPDQSPIYYAEVKSSNPVEMKISEGGWHLDIPRQARPADGKVTFSAAVKDEFLVGKSSLQLEHDYYPNVIIPMVPDTSAKLRGVVVDEDMVAVEGATVSIDGYPDTAVTDKKGSFSLPAHAGIGQMVEVHAQKGGMIGHLTAKAGKTAEIILE